MTLVLAEAMDGGYLELPVKPSCKATSVIGGTRFTMDVERGVVAKVPWVCHILEHNFLL